MATRVNSDMTSGVVKETAKASKTATSTSAAKESEVVQLNSSGKIPPAYYDGGSNTPMFSAYLSADQTASGSTKVEFDTESFDTDNAFDNSTNYRFTIPSDKAGKYFISFDIHVANSATDATSMNAYLYKNGSLYKQVNSHGSTNSILRSHLNLVCLDDASVGDYYEVFVALAGTNPIIEGGTGTFGSSFMAYKLLT